MCYTFFFFDFFVEKIGQNFVREVPKQAFQKCRSKPPIELLVKMHKFKIFKFNLSCSKKWWKICSETFFNILEAKLTEKNRKLKSAVVDPHCAIP